MSEVLAVMFVERYNYNTVPMWLLWQQTVGRAHSAKMSETHLVQEATTVCLNRSANDIVAVVEVYLSDYNI